MNGKDNAYLSVVILNIALFTLIGAAIYWTRSAWPLIGLFASFNTKTRQEEDADE